MADSRSSVQSPCAACKLLRRRCVIDCIFAPYFPADQTLMFSSVHKIFGASNVSKMLQELPENKRWDAVRSLVYEANARIEDPVYGCVGVIFLLQQEVVRLQTQLMQAQAEIMRLQVQGWKPGMITSGIRKLDNFHEEPGNTCFTKEVIHQSIDTASGVDMLFR
ncbi:hypothetical protein KP509_15G046700 [Ceratopteris richardii]|uniref:LOB domain-containing protein n=1 Tax=Ceratopteris richardii TaxID=49495 RepID=A0A8T2T7D6_CERRI|nr:hypothetical protein KP509_15G046700 [Ceratopteris richardii]